MWEVLEPLITLSTLAVVAYLFFTDPVRRWRFLGYRPTVLIPIFDPKNKKVLILKTKNWGFSQGGMFSADLYTTVEQIIRKELSLSSDSYRLSWVKSLGVIKIEEKERLKRPTIGTLSIFPSLRGKGYIGCFVEADLRKLAKKIKRGYGVEKIMICTIKQALEKFKTNHPQKLKILKKALRDIEA